MSRMMAVKAGGGASSAASSGGGPGDGGRRNQRPASTSPARQTLIPTHVSRARIRRRRFASAPASFLRRKLSSISCMAGYRRIDVMMGASPPLALQRYPVNALLQNCVSSPATGARIRHADAATPISTRGRSRPEGPDEGDGAAEQPHRYCAAISASFRSHDLLPEGRRGLDTPASPKRAAGVARSSLSRQGSDGVTGK